MATSQDFSLLHRYKYGRTLSEIDKQIFEGTLELPEMFENEEEPTHLPPPSFPVLYNLPDVPPSHWTVLHIPKTAGESIMMQSPYHMPVGTTLKGNRERTLTWTKANKHHLVLFLRDPTKHVLSQFLECKYDDWGKSRTYGQNFPGYSKFDNVLEGFDAWIDHFRTAATNRKYGQSSTFRCYDPFNMQTRHLTSWLLSGHIAASHRHRFPDPDQAIKILPKNVAVLGLVEHYAASICLFEYFACGGRFLSSECQTCQDGELALSSSDKIFHRSHHVPKHSTSMITNDTTLDFIQNNMTQSDQKLYNVARGWFMEEIDRIHIETGHDLLCRDLNSTGTLHKANINGMFVNDGETMFKWDHQWLYSGLACTIGIILLGVWRRSASRRSEGGDVTKISSYTRGNDHHSSPSTVVAT